jgi:hypothetical protein
MVAPLIARKHTGNEHFHPAYGLAAHRAKPAYISLKAVHAALDVHHAFLAPIQRREGMGFYQIAVAKPGGTYKAYFGIAGPCGPLTRRDALQPGLHSAGFSLGANFP